jgi:hypothetical protein
MKVRVELLRWEGREQPRVLHSMTHESHSLDVVTAAAQGVVDEPEIGADAYRIVTETGVELYGWPNQQSG